MLKKFYMNSQSWLKNRLLPKYREKIELENLHETNQIIRFALTLIMACFGTINATTQTRQSVTDTTECTKLKIGMMNQLVTIQNVEKAIRIELEERETINLAILHKINEYLSDSTNRCDSCKAIYYYFCGQTRDPMWIPFLLEDVLFRVKSTQESQPEIWGVYPAEEALIQIGWRVIKPALQQLKETGNDKEIVAIARIVDVIAGNKLAKLFFKTELTCEKDKRKLELINTEIFHGQGKPNTLK
jgi:hypothetical protein